MTVPPPSPDEPPQGWPGYPHPSGQPRPDGVVGGPASPPGQPGPRSWAPGNPGPQSWAPGQPAGPLPQWGQPPQGARWVPQLRPVAGLATATVVVSVVYLVWAWVVALLAFPAAAEYRQAADVRDVITAYDVASAGSFLPMLAAWITASVWLSAARANAVLLRPEFPHAHSAVWVVLGWVVPVVSLWFPYQVVRDVWRTGSPVNRSLLGWWWATFLVGSVLASNGGALLPVDGAAGHGADVLGPLDLVGALVLTASFVLWRKVVRTITGNQEQARHRQGPAVG